MVHCCSAMANHSSWRGHHNIRLMSDSAPSVTVWMQLSITILNCLHGVNRQKSSSAAYTVYFLSSTRLLGYGGALWNQRRLHQW